MKLADLGLKTKPATKYLDHGYIKFSTVNKELFYQIFLYDNRKNPFPLNNKTSVKDESHLKDLLSYKTRTEVVSYE